MSTERPAMRIVDISGSNYQDIPADYFTHSNCRSCLYWEMEQSLRGRENGERETLKRKWFNSMNLVFGPCGKLVYSNDRVVGWSQYAPATCLPRARAYHTYPSEDAYLITCLTVSPEFRHRGIGETLLRAVIDDLRGRGLKAVETFAKRGSSDNPSGPIELYLKLGFRVRADNELFPLLRLELQQVPVRNISVLSLSRL